MAGAHELNEDFHPAITFLYRLKGVAAHADVFSQSPGGNAYLYRNNYWDFDLPVSIMGITDMRSFRMTKGMSNIIYISRDRHG
jgi:hypothetical protein